jgi:carbonic anhydrase
MSVMRLFEAILEANNRAVAGDTSAGLRPAEFADELPVVALTCIDPRLNPLIPEVLGVPEEQFICVRNAGNIVTGPLSSTMRSLSFACAAGGGREICVIGHTDCKVCKTTTMQLLEWLKNLGVERHLLPENINEYFGLFASERQNVIKACGIIRGSPLIGPQIPVHGLLVDIESGKLEWLVNGYQTLGAVAGKWNEAVQSAGQTVDKLKALTDFQIGEMKFPETKIGETVAKAGDWLKEKIDGLEEAATGETPASPAVNIAKQVVEFSAKHWQQPPPVTTPPKKIPLPPPLRPKPVMRKSPK